MPELNLIEIMTAYKRSCALFAALEMNIFDKLLKQPRETGELAVDMAADKDALECFMYYLREEGFVYNEAGVWYISESFNAQAVKIKEFENIIKHEKNIYRNWITPEIIVSSIQSKPGCRKFDVEGLKPEDKEDYCRAMYGKNLNVIAFHIQRMLRCNSAPVRYLEYGRSSGVMGIVLQKKIAGLSVNLAIDDRDFDFFKQNILSAFIHPPDIAQRLCDFEYSGQYDFIYIMNTIHFYDKCETIKRLCALKKIMHRDGILCICDLFSGNQHRFNSSLRIDWITHGGIYNTNADSVIDMLGVADFTNICHKTLNEISTELIFASKGRSFI
ncbi:MAG: methyltransferase dimerization domain-containing protein [Caulobacteraceae bacterium]